MEKLVIKTTNNSKVMRAREMVAVDHTRKSGLGCTSPLFLLHGNGDSGNATSRGLF